MKRLACWIMAWSVAGFAAAAENGAYRENVITPYWDWEGVHTGGTVRALFLVNEHALRQVDELVQRFDLSAESVAIGGGNLMATDCDQARWASLASQRWDVVVLAANNAWPALNITNQTALIESMKAGQRVALYTFQQGTNDNLTALLKAPAQDRTERGRRALASERLLFRMPFQVKEYPVGAGALFMIGHYGTHWTRFNAFMGVGMNRVHAPSWFDEATTPELFYAVAGRWLRLAAGREGARTAAVAEAPPAGAMLDAPAPFRFALSGGATNGDVLAWYLLSPFGEELAHGRESIVTPDSAACEVTPRQAGRLLLRWQWRRGPVTLDWGATPWTVSNPAVSFASVDIPAAIQPEKSVSVQWGTTGTVPDTATVEMRIYDPDGRLVSLAGGPAGEGRVTAPGWMARSLSHEVRLFLREGETVFDERRFPLQVMADRTWESSLYHAIVWGSEQGEYGDPFRFQRLRDLGITALATIGMNTNVNVIASSSGLRVVPTNILIPPGARKKKFNKAEEAARLASFAAGLAPFSPLGYSLADEPGGVDAAAFQAFGAEVIRKRDPGARVGFCGVWEGFNRDVPAFFQACDFAEPYSPFHLYTPNLWMGCERDLYRSFMRPDAIVTCWTHYAPWLDSEPYSRTPPWLWLFEGMRGVSFFDSGGEFGVLPGDMRATHETRWWSEEVREIRNGIGEQLLAATRDSGAVRVLFQPNAAGAAAWARAFNETRVPFRFISHAELERGLDPDVRLLVCPHVPLLSDLELDQVRRFAEAGGTLVVTAPFGRYRPAPPPKPAEEKKAEPPAGTDELDGLLKAIEKPAPATVEKEPDPIDPWIRAISKPSNPIPEPAEKDRLAALCGVRYGAGTGAVPVASLAVARRAPEADGVPVEVTWSAPAAGFASLTGATLRVYGFEAAGSGRVVATMRETAAATNSSAAEMAEARATPAVIANVPGKGHSWFLAMQPDVASLRAWIPALTASAGVPDPGVDVTLTRGSNDTVYAFRFKDGPLRFVGVVQDYWKVGPAWTVEGGLETELYFKHGPSIWGETPAVMSLGEPRHIYDVRRGRYLGYEKRVEWPLQPGRPELFALLPYEVTSVTLAAPGEVQPGDGLDLRVQVKDEGSLVGNHVVHVELADPGGRVLEADRYNFRTTGGSGLLRVQLAWNAEPGEWTVTARDSISGRSARAIVRVLPAKPLFRVWRKEPVVVERTPVAWPAGKAVPAVKPGG